MAPLTGCQASSKLCAETLWTAKCCTPAGRPVGTDACLVPAVDAGQGTPGTISAYRPAGRKPPHPRVPLNPAARSPSTAQAAPSKHPGSSKPEPEHLPLNALNTFCGLILPGAAGGIGLPKFEACKDVTLGPPSCSCLAMLSTTLLPGGNHYFPPKECRA